MGFTVVLAANICSYGSVTKQAKADGQVSTAQARSTLHIIKC